VFYNSCKRTAVNLMSHLTQSVTSQRPSATSDSANKMWVTSEQFRVFSRNSTRYNRNRDADFTVGNFDQVSTNVSRVRKQSAYLN
jgi:hypothetical protein